MKRKKRYESVKVSKKTVILEFSSELGAKIFTMAYEDPKIDLNHYEKIEQVRNWVKITFGTEKQAKLAGVFFEEPEERPYAHPLESQGKRCKDCD